MINLHKLGGGGRQCNVLLTDDNNDYVDLDKKNERLFVDSSLF